ncbi:MAG: dolichyl-phosphate beta-glucosyltransferase [Candidatus Omnitrophota bacterium]|jgi:dolichyl-phosphate beta-glucosyltransferase
MIKTLIHKFLPFIKYCVVGVSGTMIDVGSLYVLVEYLNVHLIAAITIAFVLSVINNFTWNKLWTFRNQSSNYKKLFIKFCIVACGGLILTNISMCILVTVAKIWYIYAKLITSGFVLTWNFLANKYWTFKFKERRLVEKEHYKYDYTIIIPAYNEAKRLLATVEKVDQYRVDRGLNAEIIVVDDGSTDNTLEMANVLAKSLKNFKVESLGKNGGKGRAVRRGVHAANGHYILFTDADNSTPIEELELLDLTMKNNSADIVIGSRYLKDSKLKIRQNWLRVAIGRFGNILIRAFVIDGIKDSQCGFKLFRHTVAQDIFSINKIDRWGFDIEVLAIAKMKNYQIIEVPVSWYNSADSRLRPIRDAIGTFLELIMIKVNIWCGRYEDH